MRIAQKIGRTRDYFHFDFLNIVSLNLVFLHRFHHRGEWGVTERFNREALHSAIENAVVRLARVGKVRYQRLAVECGRLSLVLHMFEHSKESFLAIDDVLRTGKSVAS